MTFNIDPDKTVPYPDSTEPDQAATLRENMQIAANTASVLKGLGAHFDDEPESQEQADAVFADFTKLAQQQYEEAMQEKPKRGRPRIHPEKIKQTALLLERPSVAERIGTMLREYNSPIVADAAELRQVVTNKLLDLANCGDARIEIKATEMLGKISDVGLFTDKTEITMRHRPTEELEQMLRERLTKVIEGEVTEAPRKMPATPLDITDVLGPEEK